jgi:hypothetical protein
MQTSLWRTNPINRERLWWVSDFSPCDVSLISIHPAFTWLTTSFPLNYSNACGLCTLLATRRVLNKSSHLSSLISIALPSFPSSQTSKLTVVLVLSATLPARSVSFLAVPLLPLLPLLRMPYAHDPSHLAWIKSADLMLIPCLLP